VRFLLGQKSLDARLVSCCRLVSPSASLASLPVSEEVKRALPFLLAETSKSGQPLKLYFQGPKGARKIQPKYEWKDITLPPDQLDQLTEICNRAKYRHIVSGEWGFARKQSLGNGLNALFSGPPGTGKTMAAELIANELHLDLYKIDLSQVVSKYIGETEKKLDRIFHEAQTSFSILFFDEADALFGKRSEVNDAHDR
jgi:SpoVK/Ycf46/Vps4 family AAA+-type ATPase